MSSIQDEPAVLRLRRADVTLGERQVLRGVDLAVGPGEVVALLGENGSGKSTAVRALLGLVPLGSGAAEVFDTPLPRFRDWSRIGYVPQRVTATTGVPATVREVVASGLVHRSAFLRPTGGSTRRRAVADALETVGLADLARRGVDELSGGQQQRVLIARALVGRPDLLVLDEPMTGVDLPGQTALAATLRRLVAAGTTLLLVLHGLGALADLIQRTVVLADGVVTHDGPLAGSRPTNGTHPHEHPHEAHPHEAHAHEAHPHEEGQQPPEPHRLLEYP